MEDSLNLNEQANTDINEIANQMIDAMRRGRAQVINADCVFATPSDAYLTLLELVRLTVSDVRKNSFIKARGASVLEDALSPDFVVMLAMQEIVETLKSGSKSS